MSFNKSCYSIYKIKNFTEKILYFILPTKYWHRKQTDNRRRKTDPSVPQLKNSTNFKIPLKSCIFLIKKYNINTLVVFRFSCCRRRLCMQIESHTGTRLTACNECKCDTSQRKQALMTPKIIICMINVLEAMTWMMLRECYEWMIWALLKKAMCLMWHKC